MIRRSAQGKLLVFVVFLVGIATGVLSANLYRSRVVDAKQNENHQQERLTPQERAKKNQEQLANYLNLDQNQRDQIKTILDDTRSQFRQLREKTDPQFQAIEEQSRQKILSVLNEDQRRKYDEFRKTHPGRRERSSRPENDKDEKK